MQVKAPRGTYDVLPPDSKKWQFIEQIIEETAHLFGYNEIRTPVFEHTELFERGVGETTDIVTKEMYTFQDKSNRSLTLRPEGTASCVRALVEHSVYGGVMPVKWYYSGPMFRYDRPQTGRYRQFHQFGVEAFGSHSPYLDAEIIMLLVQILHNLGLIDYELHLNSVGCPVCRETYRQILITHINPVKEKLCPDCQSRYEKNPLRVLDCKIEDCKQAITDFPFIFDHLCDNCKQHYNLVKSTLEAGGIHYLHDNNLVRGLDYYTNTAFEIHIPSIGAQSAVGGGGRYNGLVKACGGPDIPGIGFALGMERLLLALDGVPEYKEPYSSLDVFLAVLDDKYDVQAMQVLERLRTAKIMADRDYTGRSMKAQMKYADKLGARIVVLMGEDEVNRGFFTIRDMQSREQLEVKSEQIISAIKDILA
ncbi:MAG: histidine--tRNA ligase [Syntrophomonas sp.]|nr:histidine--tRNA ligase [Syntrophomonas sp.]